MYSLPSYPGVTFNVSDITGKFQFETKSEKHKIRSAFWLFKPAIYSWTVALMACAWKIYGFDPRVFKKKVTVLDPSSWVLNHGC